ncbi:MAG: penicillin-binding protein 2 [Nitrospirae bacterium]|nr:penicillin-binding protein 2 [Nitrospirota bacterium]
MNDRPGRTDKRATILVTIIIFGFSIIFFRLMALMIFEHKTLAQKARMQYLRVEALKPKRGAIYDRKMREMAVNIDTNSLYGVPSQVVNTKNLSKSLSPIINVGSRQIETKLSSDKNFVWLARKLDDKTAARIRVLKLEGVGFLTEAKRYYPKAILASHVIGFADIDNQGLEGVELKYDSYIKGIGGKAFHGRDARGNSLSDGITNDIPGASIVLTIDEGLQYITERELEKAMAKWQAKAATAIMMDPMTGEMLAMANRPAYDPNFSSRASPPARRNRAITDIYEPGSTFKAVLAAGALEEAVVSMGDKFDCSKGFIEINRRIIRDVHKHEVLTFSEVIQKSSNVGTIQLSLRMGKDKFYKYIKAFGFGEKTDIDLIGEVSGILRKPENWSGTSIASIAIGQEIGVTPLQILGAYAAIANGGNLMKPYIVSEIIDSSGDTLKTFSPKIERRVISEATARKMVNVLKTVVEEGGTAGQAAIKGNFVAGKTGTAQIVEPETGKYSKTKYISSFVGFVPADNPKIALIVVIHEPKGAIYGGTVAAPVFKNIVDQALAYLNVPLEKEDSNTLLVRR